MILTLVRNLRKGDKVKLDDDSIATIVRVEHGDHSPFGQARGVRFWHPRPVTIYYKTSDGETGFAVEADTTTVKKES